MTSPSVDGRQVGGAGIGPAAVGRVEREVDGPDEGLPVEQRRDGRLGPLEVRRGTAGPPAGTRAATAVGACGHGMSQPCREPHVRRVGRAVRLRYGWSSAPPAVDEAPWLSLRSAGDWRDGQEGSILGRYALLPARRLYVITCLLLHSGRAPPAGAREAISASAFGGGGSSQTAFGARQGATVLTRASTILGALFMLGALGARGRRPHRPLVGGRRDDGAGARAGPAERSGDARADAGARQHAGAGSGPGPGGTAEAVARRPRGRLARPRSDLRKWRNWQTHQLEGLALARAWGFESPLPHQSETAQLSWHSALPAFRVLLAAVWLEGAGVARGWGSPSAASSQGL